MSKRLEFRLLRKFLIRYTSLYIHDPKGCGKTRLLRELVKSLRDYFGNEAIAVVEALENDSIGKAIFTTPDPTVPIDALES